ncbi:MAG: alpha/beta hydrolase [Paracoccaceae bacterium]
MEQQSAAFSKTAGFTKIPYGQHSRQWFETTPGQGREKIIPVVIHGGYWRAMEAQNHRFMLSGLCDVGDVLANVEYRLIPDVRMADIVGDICAALAGIMDKYPQHRLLLVGHSAGAHLALQASRQNNIPGNLAGVVAISCLFDLRPVSQSFLQSELHLSPAEITHFSEIPTQPPYPVLLVNGANETPEFLRQSACAAVAMKAPWIEIEGTHHMTVLNGLIDPRSPLVTAISDWLKGL